MDVNPSIPFPFSVFLVYFHFETKNKLFVSYLKYLTVYFKILYTLLITSLHATINRKEKHATFYTLMEHHDATNAFCFRIVMYFNLKSSASSVLYILKAYIMIIVTILSLI